MLGLGFFGLRIILQPRCESESCDLTPKTQLQRYNIRVPSAEPKNNSHQHHRHTVYASEATGLLLIAVLLLFLTLIRYWHSIHWSLR